MAVRSINLKEVLMGALFHRSSGFRPMSAAALGLVLAAGLGAPALAQSFAGDWKATAHAGAVEASETVHVVKTVDGYTVTAKLIDPQPGAIEAGPGTDIVVDGDKFSYQRTVTTPQGSIPITYEGVVSGDTFTGDVKMMGATVPYTGVRIQNGQ